MAPLILALDLGTSSSRTALFTAEGDRLLATTAQETYPLLTTTDGGAELEPAHLLNAIINCLHRTLAVYRKDKALRGRPIVGIGTSCFWHSMIGVDGAGVPLTRILTWADGRCRADAAALRAELSEAQVHRRTGCMLRASFWPARQVWHARVNGAVHRKVQRWISPAEWLQEQFCGVSTCAIGMATGTGLYDPTKLRWDAELLQRCGLSPTQLGAVDDAPASVHASWLGEFPELQGAAWFPGIGDGAASNLGSGATKPGLAAINVGTSAALRVMRQGKTARAPLGLFCYRVDRERYLVGGAVSNAGNLRAWCLQQLALPGDAQTLENELESRPAPQHGLTVLPFWNAERAPTWNEELPGVIIGLRQHTTAVDILQATTEAVCYRIAQIAQLVVAQEPRTPKFLVSGGIQHSATAMQRLADALNQPVFANPEPEASIRGAAVYALEKLGIQPKPLPATPAIRPRKKYAVLHEAARLRQVALEAAMAEDLAAR